MTDTATVETLTAEVRVLMVGNRQITMSVAKQLDIVPIDRLSPFGRIRMTDGETRVIGQSHSDGSLVVARLAAVEYIQPSTTDEWEALERNGCTRSPGGSGLLRHIPQALIGSARNLPLIVLAGLR